MKKTNVLILGNFGFVTGHLDGQTMESRTLLELLELKEIENVDYYDTEKFHYENIAIFEVLCKLYKTKNLFYLGAQGSLMYLFPFLWVFTKFLGINLHYFVVGGWISEFIKNKPIHRFCLKRINGMYCETTSIVNKLKTNYQFNHAFWFPNFRIYDYVPIIKPYNENPLRLVFMSRIVKSKGYERVFRLADKISKEVGNDSIIIDFYGPLNEFEKNDFLKGINKYIFVNYFGVLQPKDIYQTLSQYDLMLFPTSYPGEGLPGTILDSYISGIPIIASDWRYNSELIDHEKSGFLFDLSNETEFYEFVLKLNNDRNLLYEMKKNAFAKSKEFNIETVWNIIIEHTKIG